MAFSLKEISLQTGIPAHTLRYYEKEGLLPAANHDAKGNRLYDNENVQWIELIIALLSTGMPMADIKHYTILYRKGDSTAEERKQLLLNHKAKVQKEMLQVLKHLEKINGALYDGRQSL